MEKYSQFRDRGMSSLDCEAMLMATGSGIAPFFPIPRESSGLYLPLHIALFVVRVPLLGGRNGITSLP